MKNRLLWIVLAWTLGLHVAWADAGISYPPELTPEQPEAQTAHLAAEVLSRHHYRKVPLDAVLSGKIFDQYLKTLDPERLLFVQADIDQLSVDRTNLGVGLLAEDLSVPFHIFGLYQRRVVERFRYARQLLKGGFDFEKIESYQYVRSKAAWPQSDAELNELWRKRVKNDWLRLTLAGNDAHRCAEILDKRYDNLLKSMGRLKSADAFQIYMNAYTTAIDPHTNYFGPRAAEEFDVAMKLSLIGIGAVLAEIDGYMTVRELVAGGPAAVSGQVKVGDRIVGVAQGEAGVMVDVVGWRLDDTVAQIRGTENSIVRLDLIPADASVDGQHKLLSLTRKTISLAEQSAKSSIESVVEGHTTRRIGVITLPSFYEDFAAKQSGTDNYKSASRDVARLLAELKTKKIDGVLIDLRNNGGGSLAEAVALTGLFIDSGPVVQQRNVKGDVSVESVKQNEVAWSGPLGVLINRASASASEIFAAAIQDYGRGLIVGEPSFGKGTVQTVLNLDQVVKSPKPQLGELKMTIAQFFRINGGTTQLRGVTPDILFPTVVDALDFGESSFDNALPWLQIKPANYSPVGDLKGLLPILVTRHEARIKEDKDFQYLLQDLAEFKRQRDSQVISLNEAERIRERDAQEARRLSRASSQEVVSSTEQSADAKALKAARRDIHRDDGLQVNERNLTKELIAEKEQKDAKDVFLVEAVHLLGDEVDALEADVKLAASVKPVFPLTPEWKYGTEAPQLK